MIYHAHTHQKRADVILLIVGINKIHSTLTLREYLNYFFKGVKSYRICSLTIMALKNRNINEQKSIHLL